MDTFPTLPTEYAQKTIADMLPGDIYYLNGDVLTVDARTFQPLLDKYEPLAESDQRPRRLLGRFGLMRVSKATPNGDLHDGYVIDIRSLGAGSIEQQKLLPLESDELDDRLELESNAKELVRPIGIIANSPDNDSPLLLGGEAFQSEMLYLARYTTEEIRSNWIIRSLLKPLKKSAYFHSQPTVRVSKTISVRKN